MDDGWNKAGDALQRDIERDGFSLARPEGRTPVLYLGDSVSYVSTHPTAPPITLHGEVTRLGETEVTLYVEELDTTVSLPYAEVTR